MIDFNWSKVRDHRLILEGECPLDNNSLFNDIIDNLVRNPMGDILDNYIIDEIDEFLFNKEFSKIYANLFKFLKINNNNRYYEIDGKYIFGDLSKGEQEGFKSTYYIMGMDWNTRTLWWPPLKDSSTDGMGIRKSGTDHHILHTICVLMLGDLILYIMSGKPIFEEFEKKLEESHPQFAAIISEFDNDSNMAARYVWHIISYFHDVGYPLSSLYSISSTLDLISNSEAIFRKQATLFNHLPARSDNMAGRLIINDNEAWGNDHTCYTHYCHQYWSHYNLENRGSWVVLRQAIEIAKKVIPHHHWHRHNWHVCEEADKKECTTDPFLFLLALTDGIFKIPRYETAKIGKSFITTAVMDKLYINFDPQCIRLNHRNDFFKVWFWRDWRSRTNEIYKIFKSDNQKVIDLYQDAICDDIIDCYYLNKCFKDNPLKLEIECKSGNLDLLQKYLPNKDIDVLIKNLEDKKECYFKKDFYLEGSLLDKNKLNKKYVKYILEYFTKKIAIDLGNYLVDQIKMNCVDILGKHFPSAKGKNPKDSPELILVEQALKLFCGRYFEIVEKSGFKDKILDAPENIGSFQ